MEIDKGRSGSPIEFRLDAASGVPTYLQLVQQVERALRLGYLTAGDRLPKVKEVVGSLAINPNTVLKAYRALEHKGLVAGRPGQGTFVVGELAVVPLADQQSLGRKLGRWLEEALAAGLDEEAIADLISATMQRVTPRPGSGRIMNAVEACDLGKRYGRTWALRECTFAIPSGHVVALVGPNGAGKTTLLHLAVGLSVPTSGRIEVAGGITPGSDEALRRIGFVAQDTPLYKNLTVDDTLRLVGALNHSFDRPNAEERLGDLGVPVNQKIGRLSGGQQAQVALAVALARHPEVLVLDEPVARLDPLARHEFMATLMLAVATDGVSVLFSSHMVSELERVCDYLVVLAGGRVQVAGEVEELLASHVVLSGPAPWAAGVASALPIISERRGDQLAHLLVRADRDIIPPAGWTADPTNLEELVLAYLRSPDVTALPGPTRMKAVPA